MKAFMAVMVLALALAVPAAASHRFSDVPSNHPHHDSIDWLVTHGITSGCSEDEFCPAAPVSRAQLATFLRNYDRNADDVGQVELTTEIVYGPRSVTCPSGTLLVGGGFRDFRDALVTSSWPDGNTWRVESSGLPTAYAVCLSSGR